MSEHPGKYLSKEEFMGEMKSRTDVVLDNVFQKIDRKISTRFIRKIGGTSYDLDTNNPYTYKRRYNSVLKNLERTVGRISKHDSSYSAVYQKTSEILGEKVPKDEWEYMFSVLKYYGDMRIIESSLDIMGVRGKEHVLEDAYKMANTTSFNFLKTLMPEERLREIENDVKSDAMTMIKSPKSGV